MQLSEIQTQEAAHVSALWTQFAVLEWNGRFVISGAPCPLKTEANQATS